MTKAFQGGVHPLRWIRHGKGMANCCAIVHMDAPEQVIIPMARVTGAPLDALVRRGESVRMGQRIGQSSSFVSAPIHAGVSGTVTAVEQRTLPTGKRALCVVIKNDYQDTPHEDVQPLDYTQMSPAQIIDAVQAKGIVGLGGATFPTHVKFRGPKQGKLTHIIGNGAECEPLLAADHRLMLEMPERVIGGLLIAMKAVQLERAVIGVESNKQDAVAALKRAAKGLPIEVRTLKVKYPQGGERQLIRALTGLEVPSGGLPSAVGCVVLNVGTLAAIHTAFTTGMPLIERVVTVTGGAVRRPGNLLVRIGTTFAQCIEACGGATEDIAKVVAGGPMMGIAQFKTDVPVIAGTSGILALSQAQAHVPEQMPCIRCGKCVQCCPMRLMPCEISDAVGLGDTDKARAYGALDCIECGSCVYICPSRRYLLQNIRMGKQRIRKAIADENAAKSAQGGATL